MLITPIQLVDEPLEFDETIAPGVLDYAADIRQVSPLPVKGVADLLVEHRSSSSHVNDIRLRAHYSSKFEILCARCVDPVAVPLEATELEPLSGVVEVLATEQAAASAATARPTVHKIVRLTTDPPELAPIGRRR